MLPRSEFIDLLHLSPLVSIDIVARDRSGRVLLGLRRNAPARGSWFVPGGRILKDETFAAALTRISTLELGRTLSLDEVDFMGVYQHIYPDNVFQEPGFGTHYVVIGCRASLEPGSLRLDGDQHSETRWLTVEELLKGPRVHDNTKAYFHDGPDNIFG